MSEYEILAPVGAFRELNIILKEKPDAIYVGMKGVTSRPSRTDFSEDEIIEATKICHEKNIKIYVAINSVIHQHEMAELLKSIERLDNEGVDSFIIADFGVIAEVSKTLKNAEIHASTLLGVYNKRTVQLLKNMGVVRIIFYANLYIDEMVEIINAFPELDYELVAEGGTCFNDIRQCRLPHIISDTEHTLTCRSGCILYDDISGKPYKGKLLAEHPCRVAEVLGIYMAIGIKSFKIEGRTVPAADRVQVIRDLKTNREKFENGSPLKSYLHYINRQRREIL